MKRPREAHRTEPEADSRSPWLEAAVRAKDLNAFLMSLGETELAVLLAELDAQRRAGIATGAPGRQRRSGRGTETRARGNGARRSWG